MDIPRHMERAANATTAIRLDRRWLFRQHNAFRQDCVESVPVAPDLVPVIMLHDDERGSSRETGHI